MEFDEVMINCLYQSSTHFNHNLLSSGRSGVFLIDPMGLATDDCGPAIWRLLGVVIVEDVDATGLH